MDVLECIATRRSIRSYTDEQIPEETILELIELGIKAPTGSRQEPWGFVILQNREEIENLSNKAKQIIKENIDSYPFFKQYEKWFENPKFNIFNNAPTVLVIYGNTASHWHVYDCSLVAGNIILAAYSKGIGSCWIGFAEAILNTKEFKDLHGVPEEYNLVSTLCLGYMKEKPQPPERKKPLIFNKGTLK
ncbi:MAG: nitroreductase family protein [Clostridia bacterium]|nr:nitroreductase family protein [Clostridia bacterium]